MLVGLRLDVLAEVGTSWEAEVELRNRMDSGECIAGVLTEADDAEWEVGRLDYQHAVDGVIAQSTVRIVILHIPAATAEHSLVAAATAVVAVSPA